ncbi:23S rRNA (uracil(1939)-C(5))-methyltransferase RlmD [Nafulsella turpanensis]|uniref:23S rRNA (uracil(1939)-C(5))-methyltransferase RlmD n=1 Tax=Nafulsella turpanensis TaxID=1265690 RepID=UPI00034B060E|nr:23S rRNA (uracil(1939)-C(5))-methyltransferase RlmD [Nafulsella turpanensis]
MKKLKKNEIIPAITIESVAAEGKCVGRYEGQVVFVADVAPGDVVDLRIIRKRKNFLEGRVEKFHHYSTLRETPFCEHFDLCGGCKWQHLQYDAQLKYKQQQVVDHLQRIGKVALPQIKPIIPSGETRYYRNKLEFTFSNKKWLTREQINSGGEELDRTALGMHMPGRFDKVLDLENCHLQPVPSNDIRLAVRTYAREHGLEFFDLIHMQGLVRNLIIRTASTGELMVIVQFGRYDDAIEGLMHHLKEQFPQITSLQYIINQKLNETYHDQEVVLFHGKPYIGEEMEGLRFRIGPKSFYQTNSEQAYVLYKVAREFAGLDGSQVVYDLYTGTGTIANFVARQARQVVGVEYVPEAIDDAKVNAEINGIDNTKFFAGDMKDILTPDFVARHGQPDVVITDPPRAGMHPDVIQTLLQVAPQRIVYVSCNPATQARDLQLLDEQYKVSAVQPVDMFPHTHHVENVVLLEKR